MTQKNSWNSNSATRGTLWLTGLPAAGKTTLANIIHQKLKGLGKLGIFKNSFYAFFNWFITGFFLEENAIFNKVSRRGLTYLILDCAEQSL